MDGTVTIIDTSDGKELCHKKLHAKYVVRAIWPPSGDYMVSVSWDGSVVVSGNPQNLSCKGVSSASSRLKC